MRTTPQQARARFRLLPPTLQEAIFATTTAELIRRVGEKNHLSEDKLEQLAGATSSVLLGFTHIEDAAQEVADRAGIPLELATTISGELVVKLFGPLRQDIERSYAAREAEEHETKPAKSTPTRAESETTGLYPAPKPAADPIVPPANKVNLSASTPTAPAPVKPSSTNKISPLSYGEKFGAAQPKTTSDPQNAASSAPAPKMLHEEKAAPDLPASNIPRLGLGLGEDKLGSIGKSGDESRPAAKLEVSGLTKEQLSSIENKPLPSFMKKEIPPPRVVNYQKPTPRPGADPVPVRKQVVRRPGGAKPNFPIVTTPKPGTVGEVVKRPVGNTKPPLPGTPLGVSQARPIQPTPTIKEKKAAPPQKKTVSPPPPKKKSWFSSLFGSRSEEKQGISGVVKKKEPGSDAPTPIQNFQAKKVDYKESAKKGDAHLVTKMELKKTPPPANPTAEKNIPTLNLPKKKTPPPAVLPKTKAPVAAAPVKPAPAKPVSPPKQSVTPTPPSPSKPTPPTSPKSSFKAVEVKPAQKPQDVKPQKTSWWKSWFGGSKKNVSQPAPAKKEVTSLSSKNPSSPASPRPQMTEIKPPPQPKK